MGRPTLEQKHRIIHLNRTGQKNTEISKRFDDEGFSLSPQSIGRIVKKYKEEGTFADAKKKKTYVKLTEEQVDEMYEYYQNQDNWEYSNKDMYKKLRKELNLTVHYSTFIRCKLTFDICSGPIRYVPLIR